MSVKISMRGEIFEISDCGVERYAGVEKMPFLGFSIRSSIPGFSSGAARSQGELNIIDFRMNMARTVAHER